ncbi:MULTISPECIES: transcription termination/antitermination protein NusG [Clostridium]|jgi:transcriptional antiterminator NusG|uniref:Transcription termination/antitermination protein NusG n=1 Tax=Clostridium lapidicellarium TaxID=3240931 RepID=A0ABV4E1C3_9CLOT|nr:transcription termination/antitermination protein NusG [Clostridiales bacterium]
MADKAKWYVVHTYSGYENKVKANLEKTVENRDLYDWIDDVQVPMEEQVETKDDGKKKITLKKVFPGYVLIHMVMTDDSWYIVRNTRGVTGFVGPGSKPVPLTDEEVKGMGINEKPVNVDIAIGENVKVKSGPLENFLAVIQEINPEKKKVKALVNMFGRETPVELEFNQIEKIE